MVLFIRDENTRSLARFSVQIGKTLIVDPSQTDPYFKVTISNPYSWQKMISNDI